MGIAVKLTLYVSNFICQRTCAQQVDLAGLCLDLSDFIHPSPSLPKRASYGALKVGGQRPLRIAPLFRDFEYKAPRDVNGLGDFLHFHIPDTPDDF